MKYHVYPEIVAKVARVTGSAPPVAELVTERASTEDLMAARCLGYHYKGIQADRRPLRALARQVERELSAAARDAAIAQPGVAGRIARAVLAAYPDMDARAPGWAGCDAVKEAARAEGLDAPLLQWALPGADLLGQIEGFLNRYAQAYGPVEGRIDIGAHIGAKAPVIVRALRHDGRVGGEVVTTADITDHPTAPAELLRSFLRDVSQYRAVVVLGLKEDGATVAWSRIDIAELAFLERVLAAEISKEFAPE